MKLPTKSFSRFGKKRNLKNKFSSLRYCFFSVCLLPSFLFNKVIWREIQIPDSDIFCQIRCLIDRFVRGGKKLATLAQKFAALMDPSNFLAVFSSTSAPRTKMSCIKHGISLGRFLDRFQNLYF
jgi:hypothetical protein